MLVYAAVVLALLVLARPRAERTLVPATHLALTLLVLYALARYLLGSRRYDEFESFLLHQPLGYANAVGILTVLGLLLTIGLVTDVRSAAARAAAASTAPVFATALVLTDSTASILALGLGALVLLLAARARLRLLAAGVLLAVPAGVSAAVAAASRLTAVTAEPRITGGAVAAVTAAAALLAALLAYFAPLPAERATPAGTRVVVALCTILVVAGGAAAVARVGAHEPRASYYRVAWHAQAAAHPLLGTGAGTFARYWADSGKAVELGGALDAHSLYLETLAELGPLGLVLLLAFLLAPVALLARRRSSAFVPAAAGAYAAFLVHAGLDWDWEMPAVVVASLCCAAAVATAGLQPQRPLGRAARTAVLAASAILGACAIAGTRSSTEPSAAPQTEKAPRRGAFSSVRG
jgi:O-antigen ligase